MDNLSDNQLLHRQYLQSPIWKQKRQEALAFYGCKCNRCGEYGTDVHHKTYERVGGTELIEDLEILCRDCHEAHHRAEKPYRASKEKEPKYIHRSAVYRFLTNKQKNNLIQRFTLLNENDLNCKLALSKNLEIVNEAVKILGFDGFHGNTRKKVSKGDARFRRYKKFKDYSCVVTRLPRLSPDDPLLISKKKQ